MKILRVPVGPLQANCYLVSDGDGTTVAVDPGGEPERLVQVLQERGLSLHTILLTHGHFDHLAGTANLAESTGARVACSPGVAPMLRDPDRYIPFPGFEGVPGREPDVEVSDGDVLTVGGLEVRVIATPGHTPGDVTYEIGGNLFCGDLLFYRSIGRTDFPGGDYDVLRASVKKLIERYPPDTTVFPGHMQETNLADEARLNPFLTGL